MIRSPLSGGRPAPGARCLGLDWEGKAGVEAIVQGSHLRGVEALNRQFHHKVIVRHDLASHSDAELDAACPLMEPFELPMTRVPNPSSEPSTAGLGAREPLAKSLEAVLVSGLELVRRALADCASGSRPSIEADADAESRRLETESPDLIRGAIARWYEGSFLLLEAARLGYQGADIDEIEQRLGVDPGRGVSILADELFHVLRSGAFQIPQLDPACDPATGLRWYCLCAISALERPLTIRGFQPVLRGVVLESWPGLVKESMRLLAFDPVEPAARTAPRLKIEPPAPPSSAVLSMAGLGQLEGAFEQVRASGPLPLALEPLVMRLRMPFTVLMSLDPGFLRDDRRSLGRFLEILCDAARLAPEQLTVQSALMQQLEMSVRAIEVMAQQAQVRARVLHGQLERELKRASQGVGTVLARLERERDQLRRSDNKTNRRDLRRRPSREKEIQVTDAVRSLLLRKIENRPLPESVTEFLQEVWVRHLRTAVLRDGERSPEFRRALGVVDDLVWTLDTRQKGTSRTQLARRIPDIVQTLNVGAQSVGLSEGEIQPFMDELFMAHLRRMQRSSSRAEPQSRGQDTALSAERHSDQSQSVAPGEVFFQPLKAPGVPLVRILREIPVDDCPRDAKAVPVTPQELSRVQPGSWLQLQTGSQLSRMKVAWINTDRSVVLLVREGDRKAVSLRGLDLQERLMRQSALLLV